MYRFILALLLFSIVLAPVSSTLAGSKVKKDERCTVCGMFVAKYPAWITTIILKDGQVKSFDGVKDMMVYYHNPLQYGGSAVETILKIQVKDYYSLELIDAQKAFFVVGSDVYGPMGHEFVPFSSKEAAEAFFKDHNGKKILSFTEINSELVESMRAGNRMK